MNTTPEQLEIAADILRNDKPYEFYSNLSESWSAGIYGPLHYLTVGNQIRIKPLAFPPIPDGMTLHNPDNLTPEQVGDEWRLLVASEVDGRFGGKATLWMSPGWDRGEHTGAYKTEWTYRVPLQTPYPDGSRIIDGKLVKPWVLGRELPGFRPLRSDEAWHCSSDEWKEGDLEVGWRPALRGEQYKVGDMCWVYGSGPWKASQEDGHPDGLISGQTRYKTRRPLPNPPVLIPLERADVPLGSHIRFRADLDSEIMVTTRNLNCIWLSGATDGIPYKDLMKDGAEILRPGQSEWTPCSKEGGAA